MKSFRRRFRRTGSSSPSGSRASLSRALRAESLEARQLLAGDFLASHHNYWSGKDVNDDFKVSPLDALVVINDLNRSGARDLTGVSVESGRYLDVNADGKVTPIDALQVLNALNRGEASNHELMELYLGLTDDEGNSLLEPGTRTANLSVGQVANIEVLYDDLRIFDEIGAFTVYADILTSQAGIIEPLLTETQVLQISENFVDSTGGSAVLEGFTLAGDAKTATIALADLARSPAGAIRTAMINSFGYSEAQIATSQETRLPRVVDQDTGEVLEPGEPFRINVRFLGDEFVDQDVPEFSLDLSGLITKTGEPVTSQSSEIRPRLANGSYNPAAVRLNLDTRSRTAAGEMIYADALVASFNNDPTDDIPDGFVGFTTQTDQDGNVTITRNGVGGAGPLNANGLPAVLKSDTFTQPFEAFSIRVRAVAPTDDLTLSLDVPVDSIGETPLVLYGRETALPADRVLIDDDGRIFINVVERVSAVADALNINEDATGTVNVLANDGNLGSGPLTIRSVSNPPNGTATFSGGTVTYTPDRDFFGTDTFTYVVENGDGDTGLGTVTVKVASINDPPTASDFNITVVEGTQRTLSANAFASRSSAGPANEGQTPTLTRVGDATRGSVVLNGDGSVTYTAPSGFDGDASFTYTISDGVATVTATVNVLVTDKNDPPVAGDDTFDAVEDTPRTFTEEEFLGFLLDNDVPGPPNEVANGQQVALVDGDLTGSAGGTLVQNADGTFTYTPPANVFGTAAETFTYSITDGELTGTGTVTINIGAVNDAPIAANDQLIVDELTTDNVLDVLGNDSAGPREDSNQSVRIASITPGSDINGKARISDDGKSILYTPDSTFVGTATLTYVIRDSENEASQSATVTIEVVPVIRPRAIDDQVTVGEDSGQTRIPIIANDLANEGASVTLKTVGTIPAARGSLVRDGNAVLFTPAANFFGNVTFTYTISDTSNPEIDTADEIAAATGSVTITVTAVNDPPTFTADEARGGTEDTPLVIPAATLLSNDRPGPANENSQTLSISAVAGTSAKGGTLVLDGGSINYTPAADFNGTDTFTYTIRDSAGGTATGTATVVVDAVNDRPILSLATNLSVAEEGTLAVAPATVLGTSRPGPATATDESSQTLSISAVGTSGATAEGGTVSINSSGQVVYKPAENFFGTDSFRVVVRDSGGATTTGTLTVRVTPVNDPPEVGDPPLIAFSTGSATLTSGQLLAASTVGPDETGQPGQQLSVIGARATAATEGTIKFNGDGSVTYTPRDGFVGIDTFEITVSDGELTTTALVTVDVQEFQPSTISGAVFFDYIESVDNPVRNGSRDANEPGLEMGRVRLVSGASQNVTGAAIDHTLVTMADGSFAFGNVPPGTYRLQFDVPTMIVDGPDFAGAAGDLDSLENQFTIQIAEPGGVAASDYNFTVLASSGRAGSSLDLLVSSYLRSNPEAAADSNQGLRGATAVLDANGATQWFRAAEGFDGVRFGEININASGDHASLSVVMEDGSVLTGMIASDRIVLLRDRSGHTVVQIFGGLDSFDLVADGSLDVSEAGLLSYQSAVDIVLGQSDSVM